MWDFLVIWTLVFNAGDYGSVEKTFERRFDHHSQANNFILHAPKQCKNIRLDSIYIDTSVRERTVEDSLILMKNKWWIQDNGSILLNGKIAY